MATSGSFNGNNNFGSAHLYFGWSLASQSVANNSSVINWWYGYHFVNNDAQLDNASATVNGGTVHSNSGRVKNYEGNFTTRDWQIASGQATIGHNADGSKNFSAWAGVTTYKNGRSEGSGSWDLPVIPRHATISNVTGTYTDENFAPVVTFDRRGASQVNLKIELVGSNWTAGANPFKDWQNISGTSVSPTLTSGEIASLLANLPNYSTGTLRFTIYSTVGGTVSYSYLDRTFTVVNANPVFTDFDYADTNTATAAITGDPHYIIQNNSQLTVLIDEDDAMSPQKSSTAVRYDLAIANITQQLAFAAGDQSINLGTLGVNTNTPLVVTARDSRGYTTAVSKPVLVLPYNVPSVNPTTTRVNNFETETNINVQAVISRLTVADVDKNVVNTTSGVQYRYKKQSEDWGGASDSGWLNIASSTSSGNVSITPFSVDLDRNFAWSVQFRVTDSISTTTVENIVSVGIPIFRIGADGRVYNNEQPISRFDVGDIYITTDPTMNTAAAVANRYGGTWVAFATGRALVGAGSNGTNTYNAGDEFGSDNVVLTTSQMPSHNHQQLANVGNAATGQTNLDDIAGCGNINATNVLVGSRNSENTGGGQAHSVRQASKAVYAYLRTV
jgi:hypothetical protein